MQLSRRMVVGALLATGVGGLPASAVAQVYAVNLIVVSKPWAPPTKPGQRSADVYMLIQNRNTQIDRLMRVTTPIAERVTFVDEDASRGIIEMVDCMAINKADGDNKLRAEKARVEYASALHLFPLGPAGWSPTVLTCSAITGDGIAEIWETVLRHQEHLRERG